MLPGIEQGLTAFKHLEFSTLNRFPVTILCIVTSVFTCLPGKQREREVTLFLYFKFIKTVNNISYSTIFFLNQEFDVSIVELLSQTGMRPQMASIQTFILIFQYPEHGASNRSPVGNCVPHDNNDGDGGVEFFKALLSQ